MRRITCLVTGLGLLSSVGCHHVAGFCDCRPPVTPCGIYGIHPGAEYSNHAVVAAATSTAPVAVESPKVDEAKPITPPPGRD